MKSLVILLFLLFPFVGFAQLIQWKEQQDVLDIGKRVMTLEDKQRNLTISQVSSPAWAPRFKQSQQQILNFGYTESIYWLRFAFDNETNQNLLLEIAHAALPITELYYRNQSGAWVKLVAGYQIPLDEKIIKHHFQVFPLPAGKHDFYVRLLSNSHPMPIRIWQQSAYEIKMYRQRLVYGFYLGFMAFVLLSNLFFFISLRNWMYLFYALVVAIYSCYAMVVLDGFVVYFVPHIDLMFWYITIPTIGVTLQTTYCLLFLEAGKYVPRLTKITWGIVAYFAVYMLLKFLLPLTTVLTINTINALLSFFIMGLVGVQVGKKGNRLGYYFALAYFIYFVLVLTEATYIQTGRPPYFVELSHVSLATLIEAFILYFLLTKKFEWEKEAIERAKLDAQQRLIETTQEKERLVREQNVLLEEQVTQRTSELKQANDILLEQKDEIQLQRDQTQQALADLKATQTQLIQKEKLASLGALTAGIAHEIQNPLNFVNNFSDMSTGIVRELTEEQQKLQRDQLLVDELLGDLRENLARINHHGQRASGIVKNMLEHSRSATGEMQLTKLNVLAEEYLQLAYQGQHTHEKPFYAKLVLDFDDQIGNIKVVPQDIGRVLLNLYNNAFYAVQQRQKQADASYEPTTWVSTRQLTDSLEIRVRDNGVGIPPSIMEKIFQPFFTTKPTGEGTGLGLSLAYDIITQGHGGKMNVTSEPGVGTEFIISLPINKSSV